MRFRAAAALALRLAVNPEAFDFYIKDTAARYAASFGGDFEKPKRLFEQSIAVDSTYAPPYAGVALVYIFAGEPHTEQMMLYIDVDPVFRSLEGDRRFRALAERIGVAR
jgi:hypothetical protein